MQAIVSNLTVSVLPELIYRLFPSFLPSSQLPACPVLDVWPQQVNIFVSLSLCLEMEAASHRAPIFAAFIYNYTLCDNNAPEHTHTHAHAHVKSLGVVPNTK